MAVASGLLLALAGCTSTGTGAASDGETATKSSSEGRTAAPAALTASVADGAVVTAKSRLRVTAEGGTLTKVELTPESGALAKRTTAPLALPAPAAGATEWTAPADLPPLTTYRLTAEATNAQGKVTTLSRTVRSGKPAKVLKAYVTPLDGMTVGVGHPVVVTFSEPVKDRKAVEAALKVTTDKPVGPATWSWSSDEEVVYRPQSFWPASTAVRLQTGLAGIQAGPGLWGDADRDIRFTVGADQRIAVSNRDKKLTFSRSGKPVRSFGVSLGKAGWETRSGTSVIMTRHKEYLMRSSTLGITSGADAYETLVPYAMRITNSGEFIHGAPWNPSIGKVNRSHGCTNIRLADAIWLYNTVQIGDPVEITGTSKKMETYNGLGATWNIPWATFAKGSALV